MYQVDNFNYAEQCNELMTLITIDNSVELMTLLYWAILTQLVNYALVPHNTKNWSFNLWPNSPQKPLLHIETVSLSN